VLDRNQTRQRRMDLKRKVIVIEDDEEEKQQQPQQKKLAARKIPAWQVKAEADYEAHVMDQLKKGSPVAVCMRKRDGVEAPYDMYAGRDNSMGGWKLECSAFANPFRVGEDRECKDAAEAVYNYFMWLHGKVPNPNSITKGRSGYDGRLAKSIPQDPKEVLKLIPKINGRVGCWCKAAKKASEKARDKPCHVDVLIYLKSGVTSSALKDVMIRYPDMFDSVVVASQ